MARLPQRLPTFGVGQRGIPDEIWLEDNEKIYFGNNKDGTIYQSSDGTLYFEKGTNRPLQFNKGWNYVWAGGNWYHFGRIAGTSSNPLNLEGYGTNYVRIGTTGTTSHGLNSPDDLFVGGKLEVDGTAYFDGLQVEMKKLVCNTYRLNGYGDIGSDPTNDASGLYIKIRARASTGTGNEASSIGFFAGYNITDGDKFAPVFVGPAVNTDCTKYAAAFTNQSNPVFAVFSATDPDTDNSQWISLKHDQTDGVISTGKGDIKLNPADGVNFQQKQAKSFVVENLSSAPSNPVPGQIYFDTTTNEFKGWNGSSWVVLG